MRTADLVVENYSWLRARARAFHSDPDEAYDLAAETVLLCLTHADRYNHERPFRPWAFALMTNAYINWYRHKKAVRINRLCDCIPTATDRTDQAVRVSSILGVIRSMYRTSVSVRSIILFARGYSYREIADRLGCCEGTVKSRIRNGRSMLGRVIPPA